MFVFLISLFILKRIRTFITSDLDKKTIGILFDKFSGIIFGIIFSYAIITATMIVLERFNFTSLSVWINNNSNIVKNIKSINDNNLFKIKEPIEIIND